MTGSADSKKLTLTLNVGRLEFSIACSPEEEPALRAAAEYWQSAVDRAAGMSRHLGLERHAMLAGITLANELLTLRGKLDADPPVDARLEAINQSLADALDAAPKKRARKG